MAQALKKGLSQLSVAQLKRVLATPEEMLIFGGEVVDGNLYWPMVAGLSSADIKDIIRHEETSGNLLRKKYGGYEFSPNPEVDGVRYTKELQEAGYFGTMEVVRELIKERS